MHEFLRYMVRHVYISKNGSYGKYSASGIDGKFAIVYSKLKEAVVFEDDSNHKAPGEMRSEKKSRDLARMGVTFSGTKGKPTIEIDLSLIHI